MQNYHYINNKNVGVKLKPIFIGSGGMNGLGLSSTLPAELISSNGLFILQFLQTLANGDHKDVEWTIVFGHNDSPYLKSAELELPSQLVNTGKLCSN